MPVGERGLGVACRPLPLQACGVHKGWLDCGMLGCGGVGSCARGVLRGLVFGLAGALSFGGAWGCGGKAAPRPTLDEARVEPKGRELVWLVSVGADHLSSCRYSLSALRETVTRLRPAWVLVDLPASAVGMAQVQSDAFQKKAQVPSSALLREAPELFAAVLPLRHVLDYTVKGVSLRDTSEVKAQAAYAAKWPEGPDTATYAAAQAELAATIDPNEPYFDQPELLYSRAYLEASTAVALALDEAASSELGAAAPGVLLAGLEEKVRAALADSPRGRGLLVLNAAAMGYVLPRLAATESVKLVSALEFLPHLACDTSSDEVHSLPNEAPAEGAAAAAAAAESSATSLSTHGSGRIEPAEAGADPRQSTQDQTEP